MNRKNIVTLLFGIFLFLSVTQKSISNSEQFPSGFILILPGQFKMGDNKGNNAEELPIHIVNITQPFYISDHETTVVEYSLCVNDGQCRTPLIAHEVQNCNWSKSDWGNYPVDCVTWYDGKAYLKWRSQKEGRRFRYCTEAEWEYVARAGSTSRWSCGDDVSCLTKYAWYSGNNKTSNIRPVKTRKPNDWGIYDMHGNLWEWTQDWYGKYPAETGNDPIGPQKGKYKVLRGGSAYASFDLVRSASRYGEPPTTTHDDIGFRICISKSELKAKSY